MELVGLERDEAACVGSSVRCCDLGVGGGVVDEAIVGVKLACECDKSEVEGTLGLSTVCSVSASEITSMTVLAATCGDGGGGCGRAIVLSS